jgi:hypothetical protein
MVWPKCWTLLTGLAAAIFSTSTVLADTKADDRSYLPPQSLRAQQKPPSESIKPQTARQMGKERKHYAGRYYTYRHTRRYHAHGHTRRYYAYRHTHRHHAHRHARRYYHSRSFFPGIFFGLFH